MVEKRIIEREDFSRMFKIHYDQLPEQFLSGIDRVNTSYHEADKKELAEYILYILKLLNTPEVARSMEENFQAWNKGWDENLQSILQSGIDLEILKAKYFRGSQFFRYDNKLIIPENNDIEYDLFVLSRYIIFSKYLCEYENIYEFGCGSCQNLLMLSDMFPSKRLYGLDWVEPSVKIAQKLSETLDRNIEGFIFDMLNPSPDIVLKPNSAVTTIHSLEQLGEKHDKLLSFIIAAKPDIVVNYEPILEFYDEDNLLDYLALLYSSKRNYLSGYMTALRELEKQNKIEILQAYRPFLGGIIHEASLIIWRPL
ncbi:MAG: class I SAM-dependent methyltransferase [Planctomycetes bacterium]|nr:class I SAM-dependent methyltransferase [Planctomycetota bacterium]MBL7145170.1 class I SAM-dependent methyltransferase [Phycisphaerae bacterium]